MARRDLTPCPFAAAERSYIRQEFGEHFGTFPTVADGLFLRTWRSGPLKGSPKVPPPLASMMARGLAEIPTGQPQHRIRAYFTSHGLTALRQLAWDRRYLDPERFGHLREQLEGAAADPIPAALPGG